MKFLHYALFAVAGALCAAQYASAQSYPSQPIRIVVPAPAGTSPDILARVYAAKLNEALGQPVTVENVVGAAGIIGTDKVAKAPADGYTLLYGYSALVTLNPPLYPKLPYKPQQDLAPVALILNSTFMWIASPNFAASSIGELVSKAKAEPGRITYVTAGTGTAAHIGAVLLERKANIKLMHVPYKSSMVGTTDLMAGRVDIRLDPPATALELAKAGRVKVLAVSGPKRLSVLPDVPTVSETIPGYSMTSFHGFWAPAGTPKDIVNRLNAAITNITKTQDVQNRIAGYGLEPTSSTPEEMAARIRMETEEMSDLIKAENIKPDN
ncbi:tripartite tricarboxylate transporter substrate binding protein [Variovorax paradoxus]|nr:tripartite tricarboxylate transporter substrate binding protein [Variovorax paradoxus]MBT2305111.1 tripartite tricarboxylate transporter substrate binding protein [Variovorax paradoxus]